MQRVSAIMTGMVFVLVAMATTCAADFSYTSPAYPGALFTMPYGINDSGMAVGYYADVNGVGHGFSLSGTTYTAIDYPDATFTIAYGINDTNTIVGYYGDASGVGHGFSLSGTTYASIEYPGALFTIATGINNSGTIVGYYGDANHAYLGFALSGTTYTSFEYPQALFIAANGINDAGTIAGYYSDANGVQHGFTLSNGTVTSIDYPNASFTIARGINSAGTMVGYYGDANAGQHGFTLGGASSTTIDYPGALFTITNGINATGTIVGYYGDANGGFDGFLATPDANVVNGACGSANNGVFTSAPSTNLCAADNTASSVSGTGPWNWTCQGSANGVKVSCGANNTVGTITIVKNGTGSGTVTSYRAGISCGPTCSAPFPEGYVTLTATPALSSLFTSWTGCASVYESSCFVNMTASTTVIATFANSSYHSVIYNGNSNSSGNVPIDGNTYVDGAIVTVLGNTGSLAKTNATFAGWNTLANGSGAAYTDGATFAMGSANVTLYAQWTAPVKILPGNSYFQTLTDAYSAAQNADAIQATISSVLPGINLNRNVSITLRGGYDAFYLTSSGFSTLKGPLTISSGAVEISNFIIGI
jgi:hypothetical protein